MEYHESHCWTLCLTGHVPSKKNSRLTVRGGRSIPGKAYAEWHRRAMSELFPQRVGKPTAKNVVRMEMSFALADNRRRDLDNMASSVLDLLQDAGIIADDCWREIPELTLKGFRAEPGEGARCLIRIHFLGGMNDDDSC